MCADYTQKITKSASVKGKGFKKSPRVHSARQWADSQTIHERGKGGEPALCQQRLDTGFLRIFGMKSVCEIAMRNGKLTVS